MAVTTFRFEDPFERDSKVAYQKDAIMSVIDLFKGVNRDVGGVTTLRRAKLRFSEGDPIRNPEITSGRKLAENMHDIQMRNELFPNNNLCDNNFLIEMETGTGKTYVYLRTMLELNKEYGFKKFIVVVPSVAIREGVMKSVEQLKEHFSALYDGLDLSKHCFVYDQKVSPDTVSARLVESNDLSIMVTTMQSITGDNRRLKGGDAEARKYGEKTNVWEDIKYIKPIVIVDEPQRVMGGKTPSACAGAILEIAPQFTLHYTATGETLVKYNRVSKIYSLSSFDAFKKHLVKQIEVKTVYGAVPKDFPYVRFLEVTPDFKAKIEIFKTEQASGSVQATIVKLPANASLYMASGNLPQYKNIYIAENPNKVKPLKISFDGDIKTFNKGDSNYNVGGDSAIIRKQIEITIKNHFDRQFEMLDEGKQIKVLSLFFIDRVNKVRDDSSEDGRGEYLRIFDEEYIKYITRNKARFEQYKDLLPAYEDCLTVREGYFAQDKKTKKAIEIETDANVEWDEQRIKKKDQEAIDEAVELILRGKDKLIRFDSPLAFIFSHSALREGWDNPNIFTLCTLKSGASEIAKKQEIGRGLRLSLTNDGVRIYNKEINKLTVVVNDNYEHFASSMQADFNEKAGFNKDEVTYEVITKTLKKAGIPSKKITAELVETFKNELLASGFINGKNILQKDASKIRNIVFSNETLAEHSEMIVEKFVEVVVERGSHKIPVINGDIEPVVNGMNNFVSQSDFEKILKELGRRLSKRTYFQVDIDSAKFIEDTITTLNEEFGYFELRKNIEVSTGKLTVDKSKKFATTSAVSETVMVEDEDIAQKSDYEIINFIMYHTNLPRLAIAKILKGFTNRVWLNAQENLDIITEKINELFIRAKGQNIKNYKIVDGFTFNDKEIFASESIKTEDIDEAKKKVVDTSRSRKAVMKYYNVDSEGEWLFAQQLEQSNAILYTKLKKGGFTIDTPYGHYSPDWAVVWEQDGEAKLYFIVETKADKTWDDLSEVEQIKIECAKKHFDAVGEIDSFNWVSSFNDFKAKFKVN